MEKNNTSTAFAPEMNPETNLKSGIANPEKQNSRGEAWKFEDDRADLTPEETLEVDNWLLSQGVDSGNHYVEVMKDTISPSPEKETVTENTVKAKIFEVEIPEIANGAETGELTETENPAEMADTAEIIEMRETMEIETENINPKVIEFLDTQDTGKILDTLSIMTDSELDQAIEMIETGKVKELEQMFEVSDTINTTKTKTAEKITKKPSLEKQKNGHKIGQKTETFPDFSEADRRRQEELQTLLKKHRDGRGLEQRTEPATETEAEEIEEIEIETATGKKVRVEIETKTEVETDTKIDSETKTETTFRTGPKIKTGQKNSIERQSSIQSIQKSVESKEKQKSSGVVAYDLPENLLLRDVKIVLVHDKATDYWHLPETSLFDKKTDEKTQIEQNVKNEYKLEIDVEKKLPQEKETVIRTPSSEMKFEEINYMAEADSMKKLERKDMRWFTLGELKDTDLKMFREDVEKIAAAAQEIKKKIEQEKQNEAWS